MITIRMGSASLVSIALIARPTSRFVVCPMDICVPIAVGQAPLPEPSPLPLSPKLARRAAGEAHEAERVGHFAESLNGRSGLQKSPAHWPTRAEEATGWIVRASSIR